MDEAQEPQIEPTTEGGKILNYFKKFLLKKFKQKHRYDIIKLDRA